MMTMMGFQIIFRDLIGMLHIHFFIWASKPLPKLF